MNNSIGMLPSNKHAIPDSIKRFFAPVLKGLYCPEMTTPISVCIIYVSTLYCFLRRMRLDLKCQRSYYYSSYTKRSGYALHPIFITSEWHVCLGNASIFSAVPEMSSRCKPNWTLWTAGSPSHLIQHWQRKSFGRTHHLLWFENKSGWLFEAFVSVPSDSIQGLLRNALSVGTCDWQRFCRKTSRHRSVCPGRVRKDEEVSMILTFPLNTSIGP